MGLGKERCEEVRLAALLMDVGLLWVPDDVLMTRPEKLNSLGRTRLERHPESGERVLSTVPGFEEASRWVRWHHERPDGTGYPDRLRGGDPPGGQDISRGLLVRLARAGRPPYPGHPGG